ncbi:dephospho-CoA kinase [Thiorhodospira sibirica]|uniref:dephospho-CoA kinase n=1 Tax=Thiorhodospira sibirica TaxID=154347 RepID=UPI00022C1101|nr:dephospho-CoA kinase [Thiorhodospira sibirica]
MNTPLPVLLKRPPPLLPFCVGLTGGIGSGKSTVARLFAELGAEIIDADVVARELVTPGSPALAHITLLFGRVILQADGQLNRAALRARIFADAKAREALNELMHPLIRERMQALRAQSRSRYVMMVIPLLVESGWQDLVDRILVVDCPKILQRERVMARDGLSAEQVQHMLNAQSTRMQRLCSAHDLIDNGYEHTPQSLQYQVRPLHRHYLDLARRPLSSRPKRPPFSLQKASS